MDVRYVDVALNVPVDKTFTYRALYEDANTKHSRAISYTAQVGSRAEVFLARRKMTGVITAVYETIPPKCAALEGKILTIKRVIDSEPLLTAELMDLARWMACYYICAYGEVLCAFLPQGKREVSFSSITEGEVPQLPHTGKVCLSAEQEAAVDGILSPGGARGASYHYLYGPTGSGKTEVFLSAAQKVMQQGKGVIYLVPEIALTAQVERAVRARFGDTAAVLHSSLTGSERLTQWRRIMHNEARVVIGARSAVFAPVPNLGLIIIDEEHDGSYKSGNTPRYHARQVAMYRASKLGIPLVMGSATPSVESWYAIQTGAFICHRLNRRLAGGAMPKMQCIDLNSTEMETQCFSKPLVEEVRKTLAAKRQVILFLNRRGFTHYFRCMECGYEHLCPNCSVPMTYHRVENRLRCHYCGAVAAPLNMCPKCGSMNVGYSGFGTEAVEAEARALFPNARIERVDADAFVRRPASPDKARQHNSKAHNAQSGNTAQKKGTLEEMLTRFRRGECDILLGTQMVAKGLNFPGLSLVGIMLADTALHLPDFRAAERVFSLITQVAGRAGRYFPDGKVFVQTYYKDAEPIRYAIQSDTQGFYGWEIEMRRASKFPPFARLVRVVFRSIDEKDVIDMSEKAATLLRKLLASNNSAGYTVLGPAQCPIYKIARNYRRAILLRGTLIAPLQAAVKTMLASIHKRLGVFIEVDTDPVSML